MGHPNVKVRHGKVFPRYIWHVGMTLGKIGEHYNYSRLKLKDTNTELFFFFLV